MGVRLASSVFVALVATLPPAIARADRAADAARAEALFDEGRRLMTARDFANACPKLAESQRLDPAPGTLLNLAVCYERAGKTATAWATYKSAQLAAQRVGEIDRAGAAGQKAGELEARLPRVTFTVPPAARVAGLEVRCDGEPVREPSWGVTLPYDPGPHDVQASAPGRAPWALHVELAAAAPVVITVPVLEAVAVPETAPASPSADAAGAGRGQRIAGGVVAGLGLVGAGVGAFAGLRAKSRYDEALTACGGTTVCPDARGPSLRNDASTWATVSTVAFIAGAGALAGGALLFFTAPRGASRGVAIGPAERGTGLSLSGTF